MLCVVSLSTGSRVLIMNKLKQEKFRSFHPSASVPKLQRELSYCGRSSAATSGAIMYKRIMDRRITMSSFLELLDNEVKSKQLLNVLIVQTVSLDKTDPQC